MVRIRVRTNLKAGMINPASQNCTDQGGTWSAIDVPSCGGEIGLCAFPDGKICEEWALYRGECQPSKPLILTQ